MFGGMNAAPSLADIAAVTRNNDGMDGYGFGGAWWIVIILLFLCGGFGGYGYGNGGGAGMQFTDAAVQRGFDTQSIIQKLDGINSGICNLGYDQLAQMNGINSNIMQTGFGIQQSLTGLSRQLGDCCCENRQGQADLKYTMATDTCAITTAINQAAQNIMNNDNANYRQLHDENVQARIEAYQTQIADQKSMIQSLNLAQSQANQNNYIDSRIENLYDRLSNCCPQPNFCNNRGCCNNNSCCA